MNRFAQIAVAAAILAAPSSAFAANSEGSFFEEQKSPRIERSGTVSIFAGAFEVRGASKSVGSGHLFNRADIDNDGVLNRSEQRSYQRLKFERDNQS